MSSVIKEVCLYCSNGYRKDAIWAASYTESAFLCVWGARGTHYQDRGSRLNLSKQVAHAEFERKLADKLGKGYFEVAFADSACGSVPTFSSLLGLVGVGSNRSNSANQGQAGALLLGEEWRRMAEELQLSVNVPGSQVDHLKIRQVQLRLAAQVWGVQDDPTLRASGLILTRTGLPHAAPGSPIPVADAAIEETEGQGGGGAPITTNRKRLTTF